MQQKAQSPVESFEARGDAVDRYQYDESLLALADGVYVGYLTYSTVTYDSVENPEVRVQMVEVLDGYRRRGVATALYEEMKAKMRAGWPDWDGTVSKSLQTDDGAAFFSALSTRH